jgi:uncharacterized protein YbjT (DUF2867 family)
MVLVTGAAEHVGRAVVRRLDVVAMAQDVRS